MTRWSPWVLAGIFLAMLAGTIHAFVEYVVEDSRLNGLFPRDWSQ